MARRYSATGQMLVRKKSALNVAKHEAEQGVENAKTDTAVFRSWATMIPASLATVFVVLGALATGVVTLPASGAMALGAFVLGMAGMVLTASGLAVAANRLWNKISPISRSVAKAEQYLHEVEISLQQVETLMKNRQILAHDGNVFGGIEADRYAELKLQLQNSKLRDAIKRAVDTDELKKLMENATDEKTKDLLRGIMGLEVLSDKQVQDLQQRVRGKETGYKERSKKAQEGFRSAKEKLASGKLKPRANMFDNGHIR